MKQRIISFIIVVLAFSSISGATGGSTSSKELDNEVANQQKVIQYFADHDAPAELATSKDSKFTVYHIVDGVTHAHLPVAEMINDIKKCNAVYLVDIEIKGKGMKYLYCIYKSNIKLLSVYEFKSNTWVKIKK